MYIKHQLGILIKIIMFAICLINSELIINKVKLYSLFIGKISTLYLKTLKSVKLKPIKKNFFNFFNLVVLDYFTFEYPKVSFLPICIQRLS